MSGGQGSRRKASSRASRHRVVAGVAGAVESVVA